MDAVGLITLRQELAEDCREQAGLRVARAFENQFDKDGGCFVHHAYDLELREDRIQELAATVQSLGRAMGDTCEDFVRHVAQANGWTL